MQTAFRVVNPVVAAVSGYLMAVPLLIQLLGLGPSDYDVARMVQLVLLPVITFLGLMTRTCVAQPLLSRAFIVLAMLGVLSSLYALNPWMATREFLNMACLVAVGVVVGAQARDTLNWLPKAAAVAVMAYALPVLGMALIGAMHGLQLGADIPLPGFANRRYFNHVQTVAVPLAVYGVMSFRSKALSALAGIGLCASLVLLFITLGRGTLLGLAVASLVLISLWLKGHRDVRKPLLLLMGGMLAAGFASTLLQAYASSTSQAAGLWNKPTAPEYVSDHSRFDLWRRAWDMGLQAPLLGAGPMHYAAGNHEKAAHPHSFPLQLFAEWGTPATVLVGVLWAGLMLRLVHRLRNSEGRDAQLGACLLAGWSAVSVDSWFSGLWVMPVSQMWLVTLMGLSAAWLSQDVRTTHRVPLYWRLTPLLLSAALLLHATPELLRLQEYLEYVKQTFPGEGARPRFWSHGQIGPSGPDKH